VSEARSHQRRGKKTPTFVTPGREAVEHETHARMAIRRSVLECRETFGPPVITARSLRLRGVSALRKWRE